MSTLVIEGKGILSYNRLMFKIYVDADSLPEKQRLLLIRRLVKENIVSVFAADRPVKDVIAAIAEHTGALRAQMKGKIPDQDLKKIKSPISFVLVPSGLNSADDFLVSVAEEGGLCITHDIPLSARMIEKGLVVIDDRGRIYDRSNINERLGERNFMTEMRENGFFEERHKRIGNKDVENFANALDKLILKMSKQ